MITSYPRDTYECVMAECEDEVSRIRVHFHRDAGGSKLRQVEVISPAGTVLSADMIEFEDEMECDL